MDGITNQLAKTPFQGPNQYKIPYKGWSCYIGGQRIIKQLPAILCNHINGITIKEHWAAKQCYKQGTTSMVDWEAVDQAMRAVAQ